jgi:murein DD-endopeptidase MepM/ murein hydrolase activator NlpD
MPDATGQRRRKVVYVFAISSALTTAAGFHSIAWSAPNTQAIRPPQQATATTPNTPARKPATGSVKRPTAPGVGARRAVEPSGPGAAEEAKPFAIDPTRPLDVQLVAVGVDPADAKAAAQVVSTVLKGAPLGVGNTGRAELAAGAVKGGPQQLQSLQIFSAGAVIADIERAADGRFAGKAVAAAATTRQTTQPPAGESSSAEATEDDPRTWRSPEGWTPRVTSAARNIAQATVGTRRVSVNGDPNIALAKAGVDTETARSAAQALASVVPATLDRRSASIELVHGRSADGQIRLLTATIYDRSSRGQIWWFAPKDQPEGYFDEHGNRAGDSGMLLPIEGSHISSPFGGRRWGRWSAFHNGIDVAGKYGTPIIAAADGIVDYAGWYFNYGKTVRIVHSDSLVTSYSHMSSFAAGVGPGTRVRKGQLVGYVGSTGRSTGPHLHFCVIIDGRFVNPAPYVGGGGGQLSPQDLVSFREWQRTTAGMARNAAGRHQATSPEGGDGYNRL